MGTPLVSVVIPVRDTAPAYISEAVASVLGQTYPRIEVIVVDDGSQKPETVRLLESLRGIRLVHQRASGVNAARNRGIAEAQGELVAFLDSDDIWRPEKIAKQLARMTRPGVGLCSCDFDVLGEDGNVRDGWGGPAVSYGQLLRGNSIHTSSVVVRRDLMLVVGCFDEGLTHSEEWGTWLDIAKISLMEHEPEVLVRYRLHGGQASNQYRQMWRGAARVLWRHRSSADSLRGFRRIGQIYGSQAFDAFRRKRRLGDLAWAAALWPELVGRSIAQQVSTRVRAASKRSTG